MLGYLRETTEEAIKAGIDKVTKICRTGLDEYLKLIYPTTDDWLHDKSIGGNIKDISRKRPDYRSESLKLIVEFDGLPHYTNPLQIQTDIERTLLYTKYGYKVIRIPYFIQLTKEAIKTLFDIDVNFETFCQDVPSLTLGNNCTPAFLCLDGIKRMAQEFKKFPDQYELNINYLKGLPDELQYLGRADLLEYFYNKQN